MDKSGTYLPLRSLQAIDISAINENQSFSWTCVAGAKSVRPCYFLTGALSPDLCSDNVAPTPRRFSDVASQERSALRFPARALLSGTV
jgi:hypothetical protein